MKIIVDAFGGDNAPGEILRGCAQAQTELGIQLAWPGTRTSSWPAPKSWASPPSWPRWRF